MIFSHFSIEMNVRDLY